MLLTNGYLYLKSTHKHPLRTVQLLIRKEETKIDDHKNCAGNTWLSTRIFGEHFVSITTAVFMDVLHQIISPD